MRQMRVYSFVYEIEGGKKAKGGIIDVNVSVCVLRHVSALYREQGWRADRMLCPGRPSTCEKQTL